MKEYLIALVKEEDGVEAMEWLAIVCVAAVMVVIAAKCGEAIKTKLIGIASYI